MNVTLLRSSHQYVAATHEAIFRVVRIRIQIQLNYVEITPELKIIEFWVKIQGLIIKYRKCKQLESKE
jgi:hypothetical protein